jgi:hypothetical protein
MLKEGTKKVPFFICTLNLFHLSLHQQIKQTMAKVNLDKHIWEGWTVRDFINDLEPTFNQIQSNASSWGNKGFTTKEEVKKWCMENQPYYKKHIPDVVNYFAEKI